MTAKLSREHAVIVSDSGLVTITGGKWTTYRRMAVDAVDHAVEGGTARSARLRRPPHSSCTAGESRDGDGDDSLWRLRFRCAARRRTLCNERPEWGQPIHPALPYLAGEAIWAARHEAARCVDDVLARRTRALFLDARASIAAAPKWPPSSPTSLAAMPLGRSTSVGVQELAASYLPGPDRSWSTSAAINQRECHGST